MHACFVHRWAQYFGILHHILFSNSILGDLTMSLDHARLFIVRTKSDAAFRDRYTAIDNAPARLAFIQGEGFQCTDAEIKEVMGELSDEDLDSAAGGQYNHFNLT